MECDGLSVYGASLGCGAQLLVLDIRLVLAERIKHWCLFTKEMHFEVLVEDVARVEHIATTHGILRYATAILDLATAQADAHVLPLLLRHASSIAQQLKDSADHDAVDLLRLVKRAVNWKLDTLVWWRDELHATLANRDDREPQLEVVVVVVRDDHLVEQVELFDAGHELIDRLGLDRVLLICNSVCARAGKSVLA